MKRKLLLLIAAATSMTGYAQKTVVKTESFSDTQARMVEVTAKSYVRPLIVDLVVEKGQNSKLFNHDYTRDEVEVAMAGNPDNLRSRAIYDASSEWKCDAIVAATFKIELSEDGRFYKVEMKGFPANFDPNSWHPMDEKDYEWLRTDKLAYDKLSDPDRSGAVIRNIKK